MSIHKYLGFALLHTREDELKKKGVGFVETKFHLNKFA
jgi:hypothetical protein